MKLTLLGSWEVEAIIDCINGRYPLVYASVPTFAELNEDIGGLTGNVHCSYF